MEAFLTQNGTGGWNRSLTKNTKNGTERDNRCKTKNGTGRNGTRTEQLKKKKREQNDQAEGLCSRTERKDFKNVGACPALIT